MEMKKTEAICNSMTIALFRLEFCFFFRLLGFLSILLFILSNSVQLVACCWSQWFDFVDSRKNMSCSHSRENNQVKSCETLMQFVDVIMYHVVLQNPIVGWYAFPKHGVAALKSIPNQMLLLHNRHQSRAYFRDNTLFEELWFLIG